MTDWMDAMVDEIWVLIEILQIPFGIYNEIGNGRWVIFYMQIKKTLTYIIIVYIY